MSASNDDVSESARWYWWKRGVLMQRVADAYMGGELKCAEGDCNMKPGATNLEFHHPDESRSRREGGTQMLQEIEQDLEDGTRVELRCRHHHSEVTDHANCGGQHAR